MNGSGNYVIGGQRLDMDNHLRHNDGLRVRPRKPGLSRIAIPFTVLLDAHNNYSADGADGFGYFWLRLRIGSGEHSHYADGAWLRRPRK